MDNKVTLTHIVNSVLNQIDTDDKDFARLYQIGVSGIKELMVDAGLAVKTVKLTKEPNNTFVLPRDYINWVKIGVLGSDNKIYTLTENKQISLYNSNSPDKIVASGSYIAGNYDVHTNTTDYHNFWIDGVNYNVFGVGSGISDIGYFNVDEENCVIVCGSEVTSEYAYLEYVTDPTRCETDDYEIHFHLQQALEDFIYWKAIQKKKDVPYVEKERARKEYYNQKKLGKARIRAFRMGVALESAHRHTHLGFKL